MIVGLFKNNWNVCSFFLGGGEEFSLHLNEEVECDIYFSAT